MKEVQVPKRLIVDIDGTLTIESELSYADKAPNGAVIAKLVEYQQAGFEIVLFTSRNMRTYDGEIGKINKHTLPVLMNWLEKHGVPYDEVIVGKPWCGHEGFYVDDRAIRPSEFAAMTRAEIDELLKAK